MVQRTCCRRLLWEPRGEAVETDVVEAVEVAVVVEAVVVVVLAVGCKWRAGGGPHQAEGQLSPRDVESTCE